MKPTRPDQDFLAGVLSAGLAPGGLLEPSGLGGATLGDIPFVAGLSAAGVAPGGLLEASSLAGATLGDIPLVCVLSASLDLFLDIIRPP